ncbi:sxtJ [bacterium]|nr:sxtJ [bacterium]
MTIPTLNKQDYRKFGLVMALFIGLVFGLVLPLIFNKPIPRLPWAASAMLTLWAIVAPGTLIVLHRPWMHIALILGKFNTTILLGIVFFGLFTPLALVFKLFGRDAMNRKFRDDSLSSYWIESTQRPQKHMENVY